MPTIAFPAIVRALEDLHHEALRLRDFIPRDSPDAVVIAQAQSQNAILLSLNGDFADIVMYPPSRFKGIVALQVRDHPEVIPALVTRLSRYLRAYPSMGLFQGKLIIVEVHRIRVREGASS